MSRIGLCVLATLLTTAVFAQNNRSAVSVNGNDANACTPASPCRSFGVAIAHTNAGGEVIALDTAGYGAFTVNKQLTVSGAPGVHAALTVTSGIGIQVAAGSTDRVLIRNLVLIGNGAPFGIDIQSGDEVQVIGCTIEGFSGQQIDSSANLIVDHCVITNGVSGSYSIGIALANPGAVITSTITNSLVDSQYFAIYAGQRGNVVVSNTTISHNVYGADAVSVDGMNALVANMTLDHCTISNNVYGVSTFVLNNNSANIYLQQNVIAYNTNGVSISGGTVYSFGNNAFTGNGSDGGPFSSIGPQ